MPLWGWLALAIGGAYVYSKSSSASSGTTPAPPPIPAGGIPSATLAQTSNPSGANYLPPAPPGYYESSGTAPATVAPGTPSTASASGPLYHTGYHEVHTGAPIVRDGYGRTFVGHRR